MNRNRIREITAGALFCALVCVGAFIRLPLPNLPITMQVFFVLLTGMVLKPRTALAALGVYVAAGLAGLPVFASGGGLGYVMNPGFGYIIGFVAAAPVVSVTSKKYGCAAAAVVGVVLIYLIGIPCFAAIMRYVLNGDISLSYIFRICILAVLPGDILSAAVAVIVGNKLKKTGLFG